MNQAAPPGDVERAYEALRAQATGQLAPATPRGLALFLACGLPAWIAAWSSPAPAPAVAPTPAADGPRLVLAGLSAELVRVLTEMALGGRRRCYA